MPRITDYSDSFTRANGGLGANYTAVAQGAPQIVSNHVEPGAVDSNDGALITGIALPGDQWLQYDILLANALATLLAYLRVDNPTDLNGYLFVCPAGGGGNSIAKIEPYVELANDGGATTVSTGDVARFEANGTLIAAYRNNVLVVSVSDATRSSGYVGPQLNVGPGGATSDCQIDNLLAGHFGGGYLLVRN